MAKAEPIRLQKFLADAGVCSRRAAEALIAQGHVRVNATGATLGQKIMPGVDHVVVNGKAVRTTPQPKLKASSARMDMSSCQMAWQRAKLQGSTEI